MEKTLSDLKEYILENVNSYIEILSTVELPLDDLLEKNIIVGDCSIDKYTSKVLLFINPDKIIFEDLSISNYTSNLTLDFLFVVRGDTRGNLYLKSLRYMAALQQLFVNDLSLSGIGNLNLQTFDYLDGLEGNPDIKGTILAADITIE